LTESEIIFQLNNFEIKNLVLANLRNRFPERFRIARRISQILKNTQTFLRLDTGFRAHKNKSYGLIVWHEPKPSRSYHEIENSVAQIPYLLRNNNLRGCTGDSPLIISNSDLEELLIKILTAANCPLTISELRSLCISRIQIFDPQFSPIEGNRNRHREEFDLPLLDERENAEQFLCRRAAEKESDRLVEIFLEQLKQCVRGKEKQFARMLKILEIWYLGAEISQLKLASQLMVSDSLVSDYRRRIEEILRTLPFSSLDQADLFKSALSRKLQIMTIN